MDQQISVDVTVYQCRVWWQKHMEIVIVSFQISIMLFKKKKKGNRSRVAPLNAFNLSRQDKALYFINGHFLSCHHGPMHCTELKIALNAAATVYTNRYTEFVFVYVCCKYIWLTVI